MRSTRWLLLVAIAVIVGAIGATYRVQRSWVKAATPPTPKALPDEESSSAELWRFVDTDAKTNRMKAEITAEEMTAGKDSSRTDLKKVTLKLQGKKGDTYDLIKSAAASFYNAEHRLYSEGDVEITLNVPYHGKPQHQLVTVRSSGVTFNTDTGRAETDRPSTFQFENGYGKATGAIYDPQAHQLEMKQDVVIHYTPARPDAKPMVIEAGSLTYHEGTATIDLAPWGRLTRDGLLVEGENPEIQLQNHEIHHVHALHAHGSDDTENRKVQYAADDLSMEFNDHGDIQKIIGEGNGHLDSTSASAETTVTAGHVDMDFDIQNHESLLAHVNAWSNAVVNSKPVAIPGRELSESHVLKSDNLEMKMRPGGKDIETVSTRSPGSLEFLPNLPVQHHRILSGNNLQIGYGAENRVESFHATDVTTLTDPNADERKRNRAPSKTASKDLIAHFDPKTSHLANMEQTGDFHYNEGDRSAVAAHATLDSDQNVIVLEQKARMWDATGSTAADRIRMDQRTGDFTADGNVNSSRMPEKDAKKNSQMLSGDQPLEAQAHRMVSTNHNRSVHYEGGVAMWQGANRIQADTIDVNREKHSILADGNVISNLWEEPKDDAKKKTTAPVLTVVRAPHLVYTDTDRLAVYSGGVSLKRPGMEVSSRELRAYLADSNADSRLEKAFADGGVSIVETSSGRTRTGTAAHSEYYTDDQKVILRGGTPKLVDSVKGSIQAPEQLTYFANDDRLLGEGANNQPVQSRIHRSSK